MVYTLLTHKKKRMNNPLFFILNIQNIPNVKMRTAFEFSEYSDNSLPNFVTSDKSFYKTGLISCASIAPILMSCVPPYQILEKKYKNKKKDHFWSFL